MIELVEVRVENFRSFTEATFTPATMDEGMTAIVGPNGAGKSTIITAIVWAMFGVTPDGINVRGLRKQGSDGPVVASVTFRHSGQTIQVTRMLRGKNDTTLATVTVDGVEQTNVSSRTATQWVVANIGLDAEAFLTAYVVRQKELDALVKARPADRRKTIERLAGIERMAAAVDLARGSMRESKRALEAIPAPECSPDEAAQMLSETTNTETLAKTEEKEIVRRTNTLREQLRTVEEKFAAAVENRRVAEKIEYEMRDAERIAAQKKELWEKTVIAAEGAEDYAHAEAAAIAAEETLKEAEQQVARVDAIVVRAKDLQNQAVAADAAAKKADNELSTLRDKRNSVQEQLDAIDSNAVTQAEQLRESVSLLREQQGALKGEMGRLTAAIAALTEHTDPSCPTCDTPLSNPDGLIRSLNDALERVRTEGKTVTAKLAEQETLLTTVNETLTLRDRLTSQVNNLVDQIREKEESAQMLAEAAAELGETADRAAEDAHEAQTMANAANESLPDMRTQLERTRTLLRNAENAVAASEQIEETKQEYNLAEQRLTKIREKHDNLQNSLNETNEKDLEEQVRTARDNVTNTEHQLAAIRTQIAVAEKDTEAATERVDRVNKATQMRTQALSDLEIATATASALDEFRRDRLARLAPELSEIASDFVNQITGGLYTSVELDEDFTPILMDANGTERPAAWLSGGEESAVALALRIAVGEVLSGRKGGLLILDEVLTAQDDSRRAATMAAIRELPRQVIAINHVAEATDMVDHVIAVEPGENGSTMVNETQTLYPEID